LAITGLCLQMCSVGVRIFTLFDDSSVGTFRWVVHNASIITGLMCWGSQYGHSNNVIVNDSVIELISNKIVIGLERFLARLDYLSLLYIY
jgi:hypothetical protein